MTTPAELLSKYSTQSQISSFYTDKIGQIWVSVYGAKGDGVTDDTVKVQEAINAAVSAGIKEVYFVSGKTYKITSLTNTTGLTFVGDNVSITGGSSIKVTSFAAHMADKVNPHLNKNFFNGITIRNYTKGLMYNSWFRTDIPNYLKEVNCKMVTVVFNALQSTINSSDIEYLNETARWWTTYQEIYDYVKFLKNSGYSVTLKPHIEVSDGSHRDLISPTNPATWFANYYTFLEPYLTMCENLHVDMFCVGCEMKGLTVDSNLSYWIDLISKIRKKFTGYLTYAAYFTDAYYEEGSKIELWKYLDFIGLDFYPFTQNPAYFTDLSTYDDFYSALMEEGIYHRNFLVGVSTLANKYGKPIIFTEMGYDSDFGYDKQVNFTKAVFDLFGKYSWFNGLSFWAFEPQSHGDSELPMDNTGLKIVFQDYLNRKTGVKTNEELYVTPRNDSNPNLYYKLCEVKYQKTYTSVVFKIDLISLTPNIYSSASLIVNASSFNTKFDQAGILISQDSSSDFVNGLIYGHYNSTSGAYEIWVNIKQFLQYVYKISVSNGTRDYISINHDIGVGEASLPAGGTTYSRGSTSAIDALATNISFYTPSNVNAIITINKYTVVRHGKIVRIYVDFTANSDITAGTFTGLFELSIPGVTSATITAKDGSTHLYVYSYTTGIQVKSENTLISSGTNVVMDTEFIIA